jgi:CTP synthase
MPKHIFVTGGVASSLGKGLTASSLGRLLKLRGLRVTLQKLDPYINVDPGTMNPYEHGEVFVTDDGGETDLDLGHYERFVDVPLTKKSNATTGSIYQEVLAKERRGAYLGQTVQVIPHITDEIKSRILRLADDDVDVVITEVGGTVGDIESLPFLEAIRQFRKDVGRDNVFYVHVTLVPFIGPSGEQKTKPTQHSVTELRSRGIQPDAIVCRSDRPIPTRLKEKISQLCDVPERGIVSAIDADTLYEIPLVLNEEGLDDYVCTMLRLDETAPDLDEWRALVARVERAEQPVRIGLVGKYVNLPDAYLSVAEALRHGGYGCGARVEIDWIAADDTDGLLAEGRLRELDGIVIPGGFGFRGIDGKITAAGFAREHDVPFLGLCLGLHCAVIEFARDACGLAGANSSEFDSQSPHPVIDLMDEQRDVVDLGGTMRLGAYPAKLLPGSVVHDAYGEDVVYERHRHRYEVNNKYRRRLEEAGLVCSGTSPDERLVEFIELPRTTHPFFVATQAHPEFKSRPDRPHPLFAAFVRAAADRAEGRAPRLPIETNDPMTGAPELLTPRLVPPAGA